MKYMVWKEEWKRDAKCRLGHSEKNKSRNQLRLQPVYLCGAEGEIVLVVPNYLIL